jgi:hypothetical protein
MQGVIDWRGFTILTLFMQEKQGKKKPPRSIDPRYAASRSTTTSGFFLLGISPMESLEVHGTTVRQKHKAKNPPS